MSICWCPLLMMTTRMVKTQKKWRAELYGHQVSDDDGIYDDAVIQKPQTHHKNRSEHGEQPQGVQTKQLHSIPVINYYVHTVFEIVFMVPKNGTETCKRVPLLSMTDWHEV